MEIWKTIPDMAPYQASSEGRIRNSKTMRIMKLKRSRKYHTLNLFRKSMRVNILVCLTFHGIPKSLDMVAHHKDRNPTNNRANNLEWSTVANNNLKINRRLLKRVTLQKIDDLYRDNPNISIKEFVQLLHNQSTLY